MQSDTILSGSDLIGRNEVMSGVAHANVGQMSHLVEKESYWEIIKSDRLQTKFSVYFFVG